jgi:hypothetical protein
VHQGSASFGDQRATNPRARRSYHATVNALAGTQLLVQIGVKIMSIAETKSERRSRVRMAAVVVVAVVVFVAGNGRSCFAQQREQPTFSSAEAATSALFRAVQSHDEGALRDILGVGSELVSTGDNLQDTLERERFAQKYQEMHRVVRGPDNTLVLYVGAENWPFPVPLVSKNGVWRFDAETGSNEVLCRRIGENEEMVIGAFSLLALAEQQYHLRGETAVPEYTTRFVGTRSAQNGLSQNWDSAVPEGLAEAEVDDRLAAGQPAIPFYGYYFRILTAQGKHAPGGAKNYISNGKMTGGFAFVAYPAQYRSSGVKTFIAGADGKVYEKDLGPQTAKIASSMTEYDPGPTWHLAERYSGGVQ